MARKITIKQVEPLVLEFFDGSSKRAWFTNQSLIKLATMYDDISILIEESKNNPYDALSKILHCALSIEHSDITLDECKMMIIGGGADIINEIYNCLTDNFNLDDRDIKKKLTQVEKKIMSQ